MSRERRCLGLSFATAAIALSIAAPARGQLDVSAAPSAPTAAVPAAGDEASRLFREGVALREAGDPIGAVERLRRAHRLEPAPRTAYNLAAALADAGRYVEARALLRRLVAAGVDDDLLIHGAARELLERVDPQVATLEIEVAGTIAGQRLVIDGARAAAGARDLDPGPHRVEVQSPDGVVLARSHVRLEPGEREQVTLRPVGVAAAIHDPALAASPMPVDRDDRDERETLMWVGIGAGAVVVLTAIITGITIAVSEAASGSSPGRMRGRDD